MAAGSFLADPGRPSRFGGADVPEGRSDVLVPESRLWDLGRDLSGKPDCDRVSPVVDSERQGS